MSILMCFLSLSPPHRHKNTKISNTSKYDNGQIRRRLTLTGAENIRLAALTDEKASDQCFDRLQRIANRPQKARRIP